MHARLEEQRQRADALQRLAGLVGLQEQRDPVVGLVRGAEETHRGFGIDNHEHLQRCPAIRRPAVTAWSLRGAGVKAEARQGRRNAASLDAGEHSAHAGQSAGLEPNFRGHGQPAASEAVRRNGPDAHSCAGASSAHVLRERDSAVERRVIAVGPVEAGFDPGGLGRAEAPEESPRQPRGDE